jgi:Ca2+-binding EF-hand superfamily protein
MRVCILSSFVSVCAQVISLEEFREGCALLNKNLHPDYQLTDIEHTLKLMDFDGSGTIDINEFFEV